MHAIECVSTGAKHLLNAGCTSVGAVGFGCGGAITLLAALEVSELSAVAPFYGTPPADTTKKLTRIAIPLQTHWSGADWREEEETLVGALQDAGLNIDCYTYDCSGQFCDSLAGCHDEEQRYIAYRRLYAFMKENLATSNNNSSAATPVA